MPQNAAWVELKENVSPLGYQFKFSEMFVMNVIQWTRKVISEGFRKTR